MARRRHPPTRALQVAFAVLLLVCLLQVAYWLVDQGRFTRQVRDERAAAYAREAEAAELLRARGVADERVRELFPHVVLGTGGAARVSGEELAALDRARRRRMNQYGWEGTFFLAVLLGGMAVVLRAIRDHHELLRRQQNFLASVSHELKSPLAALRLSGETLALRRPDGEEAGRIAARMLRDVDRLETMVANLLEAARLDEGRRALEPGPVELAEAARAALEEARARAAGPVELAADVPPGLVLRADREALRAVLSNLLHNGVKSVGAKGGGSVRLTARREGAEAVVEVADDGLGFEPAEADRLFEKFYRPGDEMTRRTKGSGLGLYIVKHLVELSEGSVEAESPGPGRGATFRVRWPLAPGRTGEAA